METSSSKFRCFLGWPKLSIYEEIYCTLSFWCGREHRFECQVAFLSSSHAKGAMDGVRGTVKRSVWHAVLTRRVAVFDSAEVFAKVATDVCTMATQISLVTCAEIHELAQSFHFQDAPALTGIFRAHCLQQKGNRTVSLYKYLAKE